MTGPVGQAYAELVKAGELKPDEAQWETLRDASELCYYEMAGSGDSSWHVMFPQNTYGVSLIELRR